MSTWEPDSDLSRFNARRPGTSFRLPCGLAGCSIMRSPSPATATVPSMRLPAHWSMHGDSAPAARFARRLPGADRGEAGRGAPVERLAPAGLRPGWRHGRAAGRPAARPVGHRQGLRRRPGGALPAVAGIASYLVEVGGELRGAGVKPDGQPWWVMLEAPAVQGPSVGTGMTPLTSMAAPRPSSHCTACRLRPPATTAAIRRPRGTTIAMPSIRAPASRCRTAWLGHRAA